MIWGKTQYFWKHPFPSRIQYAPRVEDAAFVFLLVSTWHILGHLVEKLCSLSMIFVDQKIAVVNKNDWKKYQRILKSFYKIKTHILYQYSWISTS